MFRRPPEYGCALSVCLFLMAFCVSSAPQTAAATSRPNCPQARPGDGEPDASAINRCLTEEGLVILEDGGVYDIDRPIEIHKDGMVLRGEGRGDRPVLRAVPDLADELLRTTDGAGEYVLAHLVFDGRKDHRTARALCETEERFRLTQIRLRGDRWRVHDVDSNNALCGSAMEVEGADFEIRNSQFLNNGYPQGTGSLREPWADGLTLLRCDDGYVHDNLFEDNTDVGIAVGGGAGCVIERNEIRNISKRGLAGMHVGWFPPGNGNHDGSFYRSNTIRSEPDQMGFGLVVGFEPWWNASHEEAHGTASVRHAGTVTRNTITGAVVNLAIAGIGDGLVRQNTTSNSRGTAGFWCSRSTEYSAHYFGAAAIDDGWTPIWFFANRCGTWEPSLPQPGDPGTLIRGQALPLETPLASGNGAYFLYYQDDGNLVVIDRASSSATLVAAGGAEAGSAVMQADGNFVVFDAESIHFATNSDGNDGAYLVVQNDGNVVVYSLSGDVLWALF